MIVLPETDCFGINVILNNGKKYLNKDITNNPMGEKELWVSFWHEGNIRVIPKEHIKFYELIPQKEKE